VALAAFAVGAAVAARVVRTEKAQSLWPPRVTLALVLVLVLEIAFLAVWAPVGSDPSTAVGDVLVAISAAAMGVQTIAIFSLGVKASFTTAATATLAVLMGDLAQWTAVREERVRLILLLLAIVGGAALGALLVDQAYGWAPVLPLLITGAVIVAAVRVTRRG